MQEYSVETLTDTLRGHIKMAGAHNFKLALGKLGFRFAALAAQTVKVLAPSDQIEFLPEDAWEEKKLDQGAVKYKVKDGSQGRVEIRHANGQTQYHPPGEAAYQPGSEVFIIGGVICFPPAS